MLTVKIQSWKGGMKLEKVGEIRWDGKEITAIGSLGVRRIAREPIVLKNHVIVRPDEEAEKFVRNLWLHYRSPYFLATKPVASTRRIR